MNSRKGQMKGPSTGGWKGGNVIIKNFGKKKGLECEM
jgi:hypothetical protein